MRSLLVLFVCLFGSFNLIQAQWTSTGTNLYPTSYSTANVGIGTNTPLERLHVNGNIRGNGPAGALVTKSDYGYIQIGAITGTFAHFYTDMTKFYFSKPVYAEGGFSSYNSQDLTLQTNGITRMTLQASNGKVGIGAGTSVPQGNLQLGAGTVDGLLNLGGYAFVGSVQSSGNFFAGQNAYAEYGSNDSNIIKAFGSNAYGFSGLEMTSTGQIDFFTKTGSVTANERVNTDENLRLRIHRNGNIGIGIIAPLYKLEVNGDVNLEDDGTHNADLKIRLHQKAAVASYNTRNTPNDILYINRDYASGTYHSDFNGVKIYSQSVPLDVVGDFNVEDDGANQDLRIRLHQKAAIAYYNTQDPLAVNTLFINRDWQTGGVGFHSDFDNISMYGNVAIGTDDPKGYKLAVNGGVVANEITVKVYPWSDYVFADDYKLPSLSETELFIKQHKHLPDVPSAAEVEANGVKVGEMEAILLKKIEELTLLMIEQNKQLQEQRQVNEKQSLEMVELRQALNNKK